MRVAIVTVFNEYFNYGSFLQAFALQEYLQKHQVHVELLEQRSIKRSKSKLRRLLTRNLARLKFNLSNALVYGAANRKLNSVNQFTNITYDAVILGSDEIWNLNNKTFEHSPIFFGDDIQAKKRISYAPSANGMSFDDFLNYPEKTEALKRIEYLSARDPLSVTLVERVTQREVTEVLDPTFLIDWSSFEKSSTPENYVLVYCYNLTQDRVSLIEALAEHFGSEIIVVGHFNETQYKANVIDPFLFLGYIKDAKAIITDSFHGTIFSIQYNKEFCSFVGNNYKIGSILGAFGLSARDATLNQNLVTLFNKKIDYTNVNQLITEKKNISKQFLNHALGLAA
jgi:hypothetical protein